MKVGLQYLLLSRELNYISPGVGSNLRVASLPSDYGITTRRLGGWLA